VDGGVGVESPLQMIHNYDDDDGDFDDPQPMTATSTGDVHVMLE